MSKKQKNTSIAAIVYIITCMWIIQGETISGSSRFLIAIFFFTVIGTTYDLTKNDNHE
jgi:hypothetical protein